MTPAERKKLVARLKRQGFDLATSRSGSVMVACSQCQAAVINGTASHERGCPNAKV